MTKLTELQLDDTPVDDIAPLASLTSLERLSLKRTRVSDLTPLKGLRKLQFLYVGGSPAADNVTAVQRPGLKISGED
jgi:internalin A